MPAGLRVLEAALLRGLQRRRHRRLLPRRPRQVHRSGHPRRRRLHAQSARRDVRGRRLRLDLRIVEAADQLALLARAVRDASRRARSAPHFKVIVGGSGGWQIAQTNSWEELGVDCVVEGRSESTATMELFAQGDPRRDAAAPDRRRSPARARRHPDSRQAHHVRRRRDDHRLRPPLPVLPARSEPADRRAQEPDHGGGARQRARRQQADLAGHRRHVHLGPGAHRHAVLFPEPRSAARSLFRASSTRRASSTMCSATRRSRRPWSIRC